MNRKLSRRDCLKVFVGGGSVLVLAACAPAPTSVTEPGATPTTAPGDQPIHLVRWDSNPAPARTEQYQVTAEEFSKVYPNVTIEYVPVPIANYQEKLTAAIAADTPPDIADIWFNWAAQYVAMGALLNLEPYFPLWEEFDNYSPGHLRLSRFVDDTAYILAGDIFLQGTHYRKDLVEAAGIDDPRALDVAGEWNWETFGETARALHDPANTIYGVSMRGGIGADFTIFNMMISATAGRWFDENNACLLNTPEAVAALAWYSGLCTELGVCQPSAPSDGFQEFTSLFYNGLAGMMIHNDDGLNGLLTLGPDKYGAAQMPASPAGMYMGMVGYGYAASSASKYPELSARFVFYAIEHWVDNALEAGRRRGEPIEVMFVAPMLSDLERDLLKNPIYEPFYNVPNNHPERTFVNPFWLPEYAGLVGQLVVPDFQNILNGQLTPQAAADRWAAAFTEAQQEYVEARGA